MGGTPAEGPDPESRAAAPEALRSAAQALWIKYTEIRRLRHLHQTPHEPDPKRALMELAQRYPGSLRELDALPMETLDERIARLEQLIANVANADGSSEALPWVVPMARFHGLLQGALAVKASLFPGGRRGALFDEGPLRQRLKDIPDALPFLQDLARVAAPPGGRLLPLVLEKLVAETGLDEPRLRELLHPLLSLPLRPPSHPTNS